MSLHSKIFKVEKVKDFFDIKNQKYDPENILIKLDWRIEGDSSYYSEQLNKQIKINLLIQRQLENNCRKSINQKYPIEFQIISDYKKNTGFIYDETKLPTLRDQCKEYISTVKNDHDVLSRDHDIFESVNKENNTNVKYYALVVYDDEGYYVGHIYFWVSPYDPTFMFIIGIRTSPIMPFLRLQGYGFKNVSGYILKNIEDFAKNNGINKIVIPNPIGKMQAIAKVNGFERIKKLDSKILGRTGNLTKGMINLNQECTNCYMKMF